MKKIVTIALAITAVVYSIALAMPLDPAEQRPGTRLAGTLVDEPDQDWSFMQDRQQILVQTSTWYLVPHSVTTISFVVEGELYVPCGWCAQKRWPKNVEADPSVTIKIGDKLYARTAVKIPLENERRRILRIPEGEPTPDFELFRMDPREL